MFHCASFLTWIKSRRFTVHPVSSEDSCELCNTPVGKASYTELDVLQYCRKEHRIPLSMKNVEQGSPKHFLQGSDHFSFL